MTLDASQHAPILSQQLLVSIAEELKLPLMQIARQAEQAADPADLAGIQTTADSALKLLDNYLLGVRLAAVRTPLDSESVSVASVLYDTGQQLTGLARNYGVDLELNIAGRFGPVRAHRAGLQAALFSLGASLIEALPAQESARLRLELATHRCRYGIVAGLYADTPNLSRNVLSRGRALQKRSRQPLVNLIHTSGAGIFIADAILRAMNLRLSASRHHRLYGLGAVLKPNYQTQLI